MSLGKNCLTLEGPKKRRRVILFLLISFLRSCTERHCFDCALKHIFLCLDANFRPNLFSHWPHTLSSLSNNSVSFFCVSLFCVSFYLTKHIQMRRTKVGRKYVQDFPIVYPCECRGPVHRTMVIYTGSVITDGRLDFTSPVSILELHS